MKILVCKHVPQEGLGYLERVFTGRKVVYEYQELSAEPAPRNLTDYQGLVVMGGPMNVDQIKEYPFLKTDYQYIEEALFLGLPVIGFCLGAQLIAKVLGGKVTKNSRPELGWYDLDLLATAGEGIFKGFPPRFKVFQWHEDTFEIPKGAELLASTSSCVNQAFSWGNDVFGLQFHLEVTLPMIEEWLLDHATVEQWGFKSGPVLEETVKNIEQAMNLCTLLGQSFVEMLKKS